MLLSSATKTALGGWRFEHLVGLHHASVGEAAVVFIRIATPGKVGRGASTTAGLSELGCTFEIADEQVHRALQDLVGLLCHSHEEFHIDVNLR